jgi:quercetin dioxygenase-like cupin family protein
MSLIFLETILGLSGVMHAQQELVSCKPMSQRIGQYGCWITASQPVGALPGLVYWTMEIFATKQAAELAKGTGGTVVESLGRVWLLTVGEKPKVNPAGTRIAEIGPLPVKAGEVYTAQYMEATLQPGMVSKTHLHSGVEAFYTESGETCLETPEGMQVGQKGKGIVIPEGVPMELTATGTDVRQGLILVLHDSSKPPTTLVSEWKSKGLCKAGR